MTRPGPDLTDNVLKMRDMSISNRRMRMRDDLYIVVPTVDKTRGMSVEGGAVQQFRSDRK